MSRHRSWMLSVASLLVVGTLGLGDKPESVADEVMQIPPDRSSGEMRLSLESRSWEAAANSTRRAPDRSIIRVYLTGSGSATLAWSTAFKSWASAARRSPTLAWSI